MKKIKVGILGVHPEKGWATLAHIPALRSLPSEFEIMAIANRNIEQAKLAAKKLNIPYAFGTGAELVTHPEVDLVVVTVKVTEHLDLIMPAIEAGKAVFSEWPLGINIKQAVQIAMRAKARKVRTAIGLQTRFAPAFAYVKSLVEDGQIGELLSTTLIGSGINWSESMDVRFKYTLDSKNGAGMLHVPFAHSVDAVLHALSTTFERISANLAIRRSSCRMIETGEDVPMQTADQIAVSGTLQNGAFISTHFRGGLSQGTNFHWEINGTKGDLIVTAPVGYVGIGGFRVQGALRSHHGAKGGEAPVLRDFEIPTQLAGSSPALGIAKNVALLYARLAEDLKAGSHFTPTFEDAVELHRLVQRIEGSAEHHGCVAAPLPGSA